MNAQFVFLSSGECPVYDNKEIQPSNCWSHPGSYVGQLSFITSHGDQILVEAGGGKKGLNKIVINNQIIATNKNATFPIVITGHAAAVNDKNVNHCSSPFTLTLHDSHHLSVNYSLWSMTIDNSDMFLI